MPIIEFYLLKVDFLIAYDRINAIISKRKCYKLSMKLRRCSFIGHTYNEFVFKDDETSYECQKIKELLKEQILSLIKYNNVRHFITGMSLGVDQWGAEIVLEIKKQMKYVQLECALPCETQAEKWTEKQRDRYFDIVERCDKEYCMQTRYTYDCITNCNRYMVDSADYVLAVWNNYESGSTYRTIQYAKQQRKKLFIINTNSLDIVPKLRVVE